MIEFTCSQCGKTLRVPHEHAGKQARCACGVRITIPSAPAPAAPPPSGPPVQPPAKGMAVCALVFGCVSIVFPPLGLVAIILGIIVLASRRVGKGMATVGLVLGLVLPASAIIILLPRVMSAIRAGYVTKTLGQRKNLEDGAENYKTEHRGFYPGQMDPAVMDDAGYTGSQVLAAAMYGFGVDEDNPEPVGKYAPYKSEYLVNIDGKKNVLSDLFPPGKERAFCYYPYRFGGATAAMKYKRGDNDVHTGTRGTFVSRIKDRRFGGANDVYNENRFLLIAPGVDRKYFTADDIQNWGR